MKAALIATLLFVLAASAESLRGEKLKLVLPVSGTALEVFTYRPASYHEGPLLIVMHGLGRNAEGYRDYAIPLAEQLHALVLAPHFPKDRFPTEAYQRGGVLLDGKPQAHEKWTFQYVRALIQLMREREGRPDRPCFLIGHSAGGQILHRMAAFLPGDVQRIIAANPGTLLFPTRDQNYPLGFGGLPEELGSDARIKAYLAAPLTLYLGTADILEKDLDMSEAAMRQGKTRFERGHACFDMAKALAKEHDWPCNWQLIEAPEVGHSAKTMFSHPQALKTFTRP